VKIAGAIRAALFVGSAGGRRESFSGQPLADRSFFEAHAAGCESVL